MKIIKLYRGVSDKELKGYSKGIPKGKRFTTDVFMARHYGNNVVEVNYNPSKFILDSQLNVFTFMGINEKCFINKFPIKRFRKLGFLE